MTRVRLGHRARASVDAVAVLAVAAAAYVSRASRFASGQYLNLGAGGDWIAHVYRGQLAAANGLTSWDPAWDRGYPDADGWQQLPDWLTGVVARTFHAPVPRTMLVLTMVCLVAYPVAGYVALRLLRSGPLAALLGAPLLLDSPALSTVVDDYAGLFALVALPLAAWVILGHFGRRGGWAGAVLVGLLIELHPFAAVAAVCLLAACLVHDRGRNALRTAGQSAVALAVGAPYWLTLLTFARPRAADTGYEASIAFARAHFSFHVGVAELPAVAVPLTVAAVVVVVLRRGGQRRHVACCLGAAALMGSALVLSYLGWMPKPVMDAQLTRSMPFVLVLLALGIAPLADLLPGAVARLWPSRRAGARVLAAAVVAAASIVVVADGARAAALSTSSVTADAYPVGHDIAAWLRSHADVARPAVFWAEPDVAAAAAYDAFGEVEFTSDYTARGWAVANNEISVLVAAQAPFVAVEPFLRAEGVAYLYVADGRPEALAADAWLAAGSVRLADRGTAGRIVAVPAATPAAWVAPAGAVRAAAVPDLAFYRDRAAAEAFPASMQRWAALATAARPVTLTTVASPSVRTLVVDGRRGDIVVVGQRWDAAWTASVAGRPLATERVGPDLLGVDLDAAGAQTITVDHHPSTGEVVSLGLAGGGLGAALTATVLEWLSAAGRRRRPGPPDLVEGAAQA